MYSLDVKYIGKIDRKKLGRYKEKVLVEDVVLTYERKKHIKQHHPNDYEEYGKYILEIIENPDYIINDNKNLDTIIYIKTIQEIKKSIQLVVRLNTNVAKKDKKNSILTMWKVKDKIYNLLLRNKEILWNKLDKHE